MPQFRTIDYAIWRACERFNILPPDIMCNWNDNNVWGQAQLIAYEQIRNIEESEQDMNLLRALGAKI